MLVRPRFEDLKIEGYVVCSCGLTLQIQQEVREHWQDGHFDILQAVQELKVGDTVYVHGVEYVIYSFTITEDDAGQALQINAKDPLLASQARSQAKLFRETHEKQAKLLDRAMKELGEEGA